nr:rhamnan synthesis F family protein [uncultured Blautia sp.]
MIIKTKTANRLGIYFFYDGDGVVDKYIDYFLYDYAKCFNHLVVVCNGKLNDSGRKIFEKYTSDIIVRENKGMDVWAYKTAFDFMGWKKLESYDEITIANYTSMGPVYPFMEMYEEMDQRDLDFWGINKHFYYEADVFGKISYGYIPEHIQSYYMVFRNSLVKSKQFQEYWNNMPMITAYDDSIAMFEAVFTKKFADYGFNWDVYVDVEDLRSLTLHPILTYPVELIKNRKCPIFKRRSFFQDYNVVLDATTGQEAKELYDFLRKSGLYDVDLIWDNLLRTCHQEDLFKNLHLSYILSCEDVNEEKMYTQYGKKKVALLMHLYFMDLLKSSFEYAQAVPEFTDIYITTNSEDNKKQILKKFKDLPCGKLEVRVVPNRGRDVSALLIGLKDVLPNYDIACFFHDKKAGQVTPGSVGESFGYKCSKNVLYNRAFVYRVLETFEKNPRLGLLSPPEPNHGQFFTSLGFEWCWNYTVTKQLAEKLNITVPMTENKAPVAPLGSVFWFRTKALEPIHKISWKYEDFPEEPLPVNETISHAIERLRPYAAQQAGYYPAMVMAEPFAEIEFTNLRHYVQNYNRILMKNGLLAGSQRQILANLDAVCQGRTADANKIPWYMKFNNVCRRAMPSSIYERLLRIKRLIFGPKNLL